MIEYPVLAIASFSDFFQRRKSIRTCFWEYYAPKYDIAVYRDYLLYFVPLANKPRIQEALAGYIWEYIMGDINDWDIYLVSIKYKK